MTTDDQVQSGEIGRVISTPERPHVCSPGWRYEWHEGGDGLPAGNYAHDLFCPVGTVWECPCGQVWVKRRDSLTHGPYVVDQPIWTKEKRRERRRRLRHDGGGTDAKD